MAARKSGLNMGKGLASLIPGGKNNPVIKDKPESNDSSAEKSSKTAEAVSESGKKSSQKSTVKEAEEINENEILEVRITQVIPNSEQPRKEFDEEALSELAESISLYGVLQPLLVQKKGKYYEIIAGERRWRAAKLAGLKKIPVIVREYSTQEVMEISLIENIQREDLNPIEEAYAFKRLLEEFNLTQADIAKRVSKSRVAITNSMRLLKLDERVQKMVSDGLLSAGHARALLGLEDPDQQFDAAARVAANSLSVRDTERLIARMKKPEKKEEPEDSAQMDTIYGSIEEQLKGILGSKVLIKRKAKGKGTIEIEYYSSDDFDRILDLFHQIRRDSN